MQQEVINEIIVDVRDVTDEILYNFFRYQNPFFLAKDLIRAKQDKNWQLVNNINDRLIDLRNTVIKEEIPENENPNKIKDIIEKILDFNINDRRSKGIKILTPKKMQVNK